MMGKRIYLSAPHMSGKELDFVHDAFATNWIAPLGPHVDAFEREVADYVGIRSAAALSSGTAAIHLALIALGVGRGDTVFCSDLTFAASCNPIIYQGATPVFIDSEPDSWNMSPAALDKAFQHHTPKAVIVVNLYGQSADMDPIQELCARYEVPLIEDAAESLGATYKGKMTGTFGRFGIYSFNGNKIITTSGGGMLVSDDDEVIRKVRFWATQARDPARHYQHSELGFNYRMSNVCAAIGRGQLTAINERLEQKKAIYERYRDAFNDVKEIQMGPVRDYGIPNYWLSVMTIDDNSSVSPLDVILALEKQGIESRPIWKPMHMQPYYQQCAAYAHGDETTYVSQDIFDRGICLPSDTAMTSSDIDQVITIVRKMFS